MQRFPTTYLLSMLLLFLLTGGRTRADDTTNGPQDTLPDSSTALTEMAADEPDDMAESGGHDFPFTFDDIARNLVVIECSSDQGDFSGSGFIASMDGRTYIFTNQHIILGADRISFTTLSGERLTPRGVELSVTRDIARLPIDGNDEALTVSGKVLMDMPLAVFGNSRDDGVAKTLYGEVTGVGAELIEVSAEFDSDNSGSPVVNEAMEVIGIASYVRSPRPSRMTENTRFENQTRRFCYRLTNVKWAPVRWRQYNEKYGKTYRETTGLVESVFDVVGGFFDEPFNTVSVRFADSELERWSSQHNRAVRNSGSQRRIEVGKSTEALSKYCERQARSLEMKLDQRDLTGFLREELEGYKYSLEYAAEVIDFFNSKLPAM